MKKAVGLFLAAVLLVAAFMIYDHALEHIDINALLRLGILYSGSSIIK